jgi:hypothetical protein
MLKGRVTVVRAIKCAFGVVQHFKRHDRPCMYNVTLRRVRVTIDAVEKL